MRLIAISGKMSKSFSDKRGTKRRKRAVTVPFPALKALLCSVRAGAGACSEPTGNMAPKYGFHELISFVVITGDLFCCIILYE